MKKNRILDNLEYSDEDGIINFKGVRYLILRPDTIMRMYEKLRSRYGEDVDSYFFAGGFEGGRLSSEKYRDNFGLDDMGLIDFMLTMGANIGWGKFDLVEYNPEEKVLVVKVSNSAFVVKDKPTNFSVCHFIRGVMSGMASVLFSGEVESSEDRCAAKGDDYCLFTVKGL